MHRPSPTRLAPRLPGSRGRDLRDNEIILDDPYHAGTYGIPDKSTLSAMRLAARLEAMITDPVYEGSR
jgi:1-aminocyclopropane-1-carboxylate deaminase